MGVEEWGGKTRDNMKKKKFSILLMVLISFSVNLAWSQELKKDSTIINLLLKKALFSEYSKFITGKPNISSGSFASYDITENQVNFSYLGVTKKQNIFGFQISGQNTDGKLPFINNGSKNSNITFNPYFNILRKKENLIEYLDDFTLKKEVELLEIEKKYLTESSTLELIKNELELEKTKLSTDIMIWQNKIKLADTDSLRFELKKEINEKIINQKMNLKKLEIYNEERISSEKVKLGNDRIKDKRQFFDSIKFDFKEFEVDWFQISPYLNNSLLSFKKDTSSSNKKRTRERIGNKRSRKPSPTLIAPYATSPLCNN